MRILVIEDSSSDWAYFQAHASQIRNGSTWDIERAARIPEAEERMAEREFDAIVCDLNLPGSSEPETIKWLEGRSEPIVVCTSSPNKDTYVGCIAAGAKAFLAKDALSCNAIHAAVHAAILESQQSELRAGVEKISSAVESLQKGAPSS